jgi:hypothetical protein
MHFGFVRANTNDSVAVSFYVNHAIDNFRVVVFPDTNSSCTGEPADLRISKDDHDHLWGDDPLIPYEFHVTNAGGTATDATVVETVPTNTTFSAADSTPGWSCTPNASAGSTCEIVVTELAAGETRSVEFAVRVNDGTDPKWDVYNSSGVKTGGATEVATSDRNTPSGGCAAGLDLITCCAFCNYAPGSCVPGSLPAQVAGVAPAASLAGTPADALLLHRLRDRVFAHTRGGSRAIDLYYEHSADITSAAVTTPSLITSGLDSLSQWLPLVQSLVSGQGGQAVVTSTQIDGLNAFLDDLRAAASETLGAAIDRERPRLALASWIGVTMDQALARLDRLTCEGYETTLFCGELTGDCEIRAGDALKALLMAISLEEPDPAADMDGSGGVAAQDALRILRIAVALEPDTTACNG